MKARAEDRHVVTQSAAVSDHLRDHHDRNGDRKRDPTINGGEDVLPAESGLTPVGDPRHGVYRNAVGQKFQTNRAGTIQRLGGPTDEMVGKTENKIQAINETMTHVGATRYSIEFGCEIAVESGSFMAMIGKVGAKSQFKVTVEWSRDQNAS